MPNLNGWAMVSRVKMLSRLCTEVEHATRNNYFRGEIRDPKCLKGRFSIPILLFYPNIRAKPDSITDNFKVDQNPIGKLSFNFRILKPNEKVFAESIHYFFKKSFTTFSSGPDCKFIPVF